MKGLFLLISESPNQSRVVFKKTLKVKHTTLLPEKTKQGLSELQQLESLFPQLAVSTGPEEQKTTKRILNDDLNDDQIYFGLSKSFFKELFLPKGAQFVNNSFDITVDDNRFLSFPCTIEESGQHMNKKTKKEGKLNKGRKEDFKDDKPQLEQSRSQQVTYNQHEGKMNVRAISVIFVIGAYNEKELTRLDYYKAFIQALTQALVREQQREQFVGKQCYKILRLKQQARDEISQSPQSKANLKQNIVKKSSLARLITEVFESFVLQRPITVKINNWISMTVNHETYQPGYSPDELCKTFFQKAESVKVMPNQTLLLLNPDRTFAMLQEEKTPLFTECIKGLNPMRSLSQMCVDQGISFSEIVKVAQHLIFWGQAKLMYPINLNQVYVLKQKSTNEMSALKRNFGFQLMNQNAKNIEQIIEKFSSPKQLNVVFESNTMTLREFVNQIIYLLQQDIIEEKNYYMVLKIPSKFKDIRKLQINCFNQQEASLMTLKEKKMHKEPSQPITSTEQTEKSQALCFEDFLEVARDESDSDFQLLECLYPFFDGEFNHHDLMLIGNCSQQLLMRMVDKYSSVVAKFLL